MFDYAFLILLLPFLSAVVLGLFGMKMPRKVAGIIGTCMLGTLFVLSLYTAYHYFFYTGEYTAMGETFNVTDGRLANGTYPTVTVFNITWLKFTELLTFNIGFRLSPISVMMLIVITTVSLMVHIYSFGYMAERDENYKFEDLMHVTIAYCFGTPCAAYSEDTHLLRQDRLKNRIQRRDKPLRDVALPCPRWWAISRVAGQ